MDNSTHNNNDEMLLVRYLDGDISSVEKAEVEILVTRDGRLKQRLDDLQLAKEAVLQYGLKLKVAGIHRQMMQEISMAGASVKSMISMKRVIRISIAAAATVLLAWVSIQLYRDYTMTPDKLYARQFTHYELPVLRSGNQSSIPSLLETAYRDKDYNEVIRVYKTSGGATEEDAFLAGMSMLETKNYEEAIPAFNRVLEINKNKPQTSPARYTDAAMYYISLAYLKNKRYDQALRAMQSVYDNPDHLYHKKITSKLMRRLKRLQ